MPYRPPRSAELEEGRDTRVARRVHAQQEKYVSLLRHAQRVRENSQQPESPELSFLIKSADDMLRKLDQEIDPNRPIEPRKRPTKALSGKTCRVFIDECGAFQLTSPDAYPVFVVSAVIVEEENWATVDALWKRFKAQALGSPNVVIHEPDIRRRRWPFAEPERTARLEAMRQAIEPLDFKAIGIVVNRPNYVKDHGLGPLDASLPAHTYWMALDFLMERLVMALDGEFGGARAVITVESREKKEDALLQYEFTRLMLDGTSYIKETWFRQSLYPGIIFEGKDTNNTGLQVADVIARPMGDKVVSPNSSPYLWPEFKGKLCPTKQTKNSILGLKVLPWRDEYDDLWLS